VKFRFLAGLALAIAGDAGAGAAYSDVSAILNAHCVVCHQGEAAPLGSYAACAARASRACRSPGRRG